MSTELQHLIETITGYDATLVAVSKTKPIDQILELYRNGLTDFGENRVQDLVSKHDQLPPDIRWHFIGHLQKNKVKYIAPFVHCIHSVDSLELMKVINKEGVKNSKMIMCLLQIRIAREETKFGLLENEAFDLLERCANGDFPHINLRGFMGMATFTADMEVVRAEFKQLKEFSDRMQDHFKNRLSSLTEISMGMSGDFEVALEEGATMVRIGSLIFGART